MSLFDNQLLSLFSNENWHWQIVLIIITTLLVNFFIHHSLKKLEVQVQKTNNLWDDAILHSAYLPIRLIGWLIGLSLILTIYQQHQPITTFSSLFYQFRKIAFIMVLALFLYRLVINFRNELLKEQSSKYWQKYSKLDETSIDALAKILLLSIVIATILTILQILGYSISGILAFGGMGGIAVGFASKDLLANFFGGFMIYLDKPFKIGDWIRSPDRSIEGVVEHIGWRISRIRTFDKRPLYIPNSLFTQIIVENPSRMSHRQINENIGIRYADWQKMPSIVHDVKNMLINHQDIDDKQTLICNFNAFNQSSIDFLVYTYTVTTDWVTYHQVKQDVLFKIFEIIANHGAEIAFPTQTLLMENNIKMQKVSQTDVL